MNFDLIVIGSGPAGYKTAVSAAHHGARVALVEHGLPGGNCLNRGCIPKKALVYLASLIEDVDSLQGRGIVGSVRGDYAAAVLHKDQVVTGIRDGFAFGLRRLGIELVRAEARLQPGLRVALRPLEGQVAPLAAELSAGRIAIATGSAPRRHNTCPADGERILDSSQFMRTLHECPDSMLFVGGGTVGVELAYLMHQFGARACIAEPSDRLLDRHSISERASGALERKFRRLAIEVRKGVSVSACAPDAHGVNVTFSDGSADHFEKVLVGIGRRPRTEDLGLAEAGIDLDEDGFIRVSEYLETSLPGIYAAESARQGGKLLRVRYPWSRK